MYVNVGKYTSPMDPSWVIKKNITWKSAIGPSNEGVHEPVKKKTRGVFWGPQKWPIVRLGNLRVDNIQDYSPEN